MKVWYFKRHQCGRCERTVDHVPCEPYKALYPKIVGSLCSMCAMEMEYEKKEREEGIYAT